MSTLYKMCPRCGCAKLNTLTGTCSQCGYGKPKSQALPPVYRLAERLGDDKATYRDYQNDNGQTLTVKATGPDGDRTEQDTATEAARIFARSNLRKAS